MPSMNFHPPSLSDAFEGENTVWTQLKAALRNRDGDTFYRLPIVNSSGRFMYEPDMVLTLRGYMPLVLECKGCRLRDIVSINGLVWTMVEPWYRAQENPVNQARDQAIALGSMLSGPDQRLPPVHSLVVLPFVSRAKWNERFGDLGITPGIVFADDIASPEAFAARIVAAASASRVSPEHWNRLAQVLGAKDRWAVAADEAPPPQRPRAPRASAALPVVAAPGDPAAPGIHILRYAGRPPTASELCQKIGIATATPHTYLVATAALERQRRKEGLGGQHQLKKELRDDALEPEQMQLLFHKALRHFIARPMLSRTEERVLIQRAIRVLAKDDGLVGEQLRRDVFAWRDVLAELEEEGVDLGAAGASTALWAHPDLERLAASLQSTYRKMRCDSGGAKPTFEESARHYLSVGYVPTPVVVMEGFTRLTPLQQEFIERCAELACVCLWIVLPHNPAQEKGFKALDRTYQPFAGRATYHLLPTPPLSTQSSLAHLQAGLFSHDAVPGAFSDDGVSLSAFPHRNDEVADCVGKVIQMIEDGELAAKDVAIVCSDPQGMAPLLREEAELRNRADWFSVPPRQLLLTPVGRFILVLYEIWKTNGLEMDPEQFATLLASGWLGGHAGKSAELFVAVARQHFSFCRSEPEWCSAFDRIEQQMEEGDRVLGKLAERLPASLVTVEDLVTWRGALATVARLCIQLFAAGERPIGAHIGLLLDEIERLDQHRILQAEREILTDIRAAFADMRESRSVAIDAMEFGEVLSGLIRERQDDPDGDIPGSSPGTRLQQVWVVGPEGIDNISRHTVFFLGTDESRMPALGTPPWPRVTWSAQEHVDRQRYRFLAVVRAAQGRLFISYARQDWEKHHQASPYFDEAVHLLSRSVGVVAATTESVSPPVPAPAARMPMERQTYTVSELALHRLCPYRFKMEGLTKWAGRYTSSWQIEWLGQGVWLAYALHHLATRAPGPHDAEEFRGLFETAVDEVRPQVEARLPGLPLLAWTGIEHQVRLTVAHLLKPTGASKQRRVLGVAIPPTPRGRLWEVSVDENRTVTILAEADFQVYRDSFLNFVKETNQSALWLSVGSDKQGVSDDADEDEHLFKKLRQATNWWRDVTYWATRDDESLDPDTVNELTESIWKLEQGHFRKNPGDHCRYCPVADTCMGLKP